MIQIHQIYIQTLSQKNHVSMFHTILHHFYAKLEKVQIRQIQCFHSEAKTAVKWRWKHILSTAAKIFSFHLLSYILIWQLFNLEFPYIFTFISSRSEFKRPRNSTGCSMIGNVWRHYGDFDLRNIRNHATVFYVRLNGFHFIVHVYSSLL